LNRPGSNRAGMIVHNDQGGRRLRYAAIAPMAVLHPVMVNCDIELACF